MKMDNHILVVEDDAAIREGVRILLEGEGYIVQEAEDGYQCLKKVSDDIDLVILDIMMPGTDGLTVCKQLREKSDVPIIMLTAKDSEYDYVHGITIGSDDYLTKPFRPTTLLMRVRSLLRRMDMNERADSLKNHNETISVGDLVFSGERNEILCSGKPIKLTQTELKMLSYMMKNPQKAYSREDLLNAIWGYDTRVETRVTDETLRRIRKQLSLCGSNVSVRTMWGFGYKLEIVGETK